MKIHMWKWSVYFINTHGLLGLIGCLGVWKEKVGKKCGKICGRAVCSPMGMGTNAYHRKGTEQPGRQNDWPWRGWGEGCSRVDSLLLRACARRLCGSHGEGWRLGMDPWIKLSLLTNLSAQRQASDPWSASHWTHIDYLCSFHCGRSPFFLGW